MSGSSVCLWILFQSIQIGCSLNALDHSYQLPVQHSAGNRNLYKDEEKMLKLLRFILQSFRLQFIRNRVVYCYFYFAGNVYVSCYSIFKGSQLSGFPLDISFYFIGYLFFISFFVLHLLL